MIKERGDVSFLCLIVTRDGDDIMQRLTYMPLYFAYVTVLIS